MLIAKVQGQTVLDVADYQSMFPDVSFPPSGPTAEWMAENSCLPVSVWLPYDPATQYLESVAPYVNGDTVYTVQVAQLTPEMIEQIHQNEAAQNKQKGKQILSDTDWTAIPSVADPLQSNPYLTNQAEFLAYRSAVRDIVLNPTWDAVFPIPPEEIWSNQG